MCMPRRVRNSNAVIPNPMTQIRRIGLSIVLDSIDTDAIPLVPRTIDEILTRSWVSGIDGGKRGLGEGLVAGGTEDGVELDENMVVVGVLIMAGKTHGSGEGFGGCGEVAAFAEGEVGPAFLEAG